MVTPILPENEGRYNYPYIQYQVQSPSSAIITRPLPTGATPNLPRDITPALAVVISDVSGVATPTTLRLALLLQRDPDGDHHQQSQHQQEHTVSSIKHRHLLSTILLA